MQNLANKLGTVLVLAIIAAAIYVAAKVVPFYVDNMDVEEAVSATFNLAGRNNNDGILRGEIRSRTNRMGSHVETDSWGVDHVVPGLGLTDEQILIERSHITDNVRIEVTYQREVEFPLFNYVHVLELRVVKEGIPPP
ncbi:MAG: hypothetical protein JXB05_06645 [Myxococcaceae bacterium]|nr:hypothetical protein [Myxococcaceae bacterium]